MSGRYENILVVDFEATCWDDESDKNLQYDQEIIEIGVVQVNQYEREVTDYENYLIKPSYGEISPFCESLTSITSDLVNEHGVLLTQAVQAIEERFKARVWGSWGSWDVKRFRWDCENKSVKNPFEYSTHINIAQLLCMLQGFKNRKGLKSGMMHTDVDWQQDVMQKYDVEGMARHRALPDALAAAEILLKLIESK